MSLETKVVEDFMKRWDVLLPQEKRQEFYKDTCDLVKAQIETATNKVLLSFRMPPVSMDQFTPGESRKDNP